MKWSNSSAYEEKPVWGKRKIGTLHRLKPLDPTQLNKLSFFLLQD